MALLKIRAACLMYSLNQSSCNESIERTQFAGISNLKGQCL